MTIHALEIPDATADLAQWLERHLVGLHLGELVTELAVIQGSPGGTSDLRDVLGQEYVAVLESGLQSLSHEQLQMLSAQPRLLIELQELVLTQGGGFWLQRGMENSELAALIAPGPPRLSVPAGGTTSPRSREK